MLKGINPLLRWEESHPMKFVFLHMRIKNREYERLDDNAKDKLITNNDNEIQDFIKHPIVIKNRFDTSYISEKMLKQLILEDISSFMDELGDSYSFIKSEYKI